MNHIKTSALAVLLIPGLLLAGCGKKDEAAAPAEGEAAAPAAEAAAPAAVEEAPATREAIERESVAHGRYFAPGYGIHEDPVTGAVQGPLGAYLALARVVQAPPPGQTLRVRSEQGDAMGKPGRVLLELATGDDGALKVRIGGVATTVLHGTLLV